MARHEIKSEEVIEFINEHLVHFASSTKEKKYFEISLNGNYTVTHYGRTVLSTSNLQEAVNKYNSLDKIY